MVVGLAQDLHTAGVDEGLEGVEGLGTEPPELLDDRPGQGVGHLEISPETPDEPQHQPVGREVAFLGHLLEDLSVGHVILIEVIFTDIKKCIFP